MWRHEFLRSSCVRALAEKEMGPKFDIRDPHDVVLRNGVSPLDVLEERVRAWIAQSRKQPEPRGTH